MIPYLHLGPLTIPTFGLMVALALIGAAYILQADFDRRGMKADAFFMITVAGLDGHAGRETVPPAGRAASIFFAIRGGCCSAVMGLHGLAGYLGGFAALLFLGWRAKLPLLQFLDACSPAACFWLWHRAHRLFSFWGWGLRQADELAMGNELSKWCCANDGFLRAVGMARKL